MSQPYPPPYQHQQPSQPTQQQWGPPPGYPPHAGMPPHVPTQRGPLSQPPKQPQRRPLVGAIVLTLLIVGGAAFGIYVFGKPTTTSTTTGGSTSTSRAAAPAVTVPVQVPAGPAKQIAARDWAKIAKDPEAYKGQSIVVYGQVTQFDSATGTDAFRANVDAVKHEVSYGYADYETNTMLGGSAAVLADLVDKDLFRAEVVVAGAYSYETTMGGQTTVPLLRVTKIQTIGTAK